MSPQVEFSDIYWSVASPQIIIMQFADRLTIDTCAMSDINTWSVTLYWNYASLKADSTIIEVFNMSLQHMQKQNTHKLKAHYWLDSGVPLNRGVIT